MFFPWPCTTHRSAGTPCRTSAHKLPSCTPVEAGRVYRVQVNEEEKSELVKKLVDGFGDAFH